MLKLSKSYSYTDRREIETAAGTYLVETVYTDTVNTRFGNAVNHIAPAIAMIIGALTPIIAAIIVS